MLSRIARVGFVAALSLPAAFPSGRSVSAAPSPDADYRIAFASATGIERELDELGRDGYACVSLARPEPGSRVPGIVAIAARTANTTGPVATHRVIVGGRDDMTVPLTKAGAEGFHLCGVVLDEGPSNPRDVAVMTRTTPGTWQYNVEVLLRYKESLARLNTSGHDGFVPVAAAPIDNNRVPDQRNWMIVAERPATGAVPHDVMVRSDTGPAGLGRSLNDSGSQGYRVDLAWKEGSDFVAMMTRPAGSAAPAHTYAVEGDALSRMHSLPGLALADFPYLDRRLFVTDAGVRASNELVEETLPALARNGSVEPKARSAMGAIGDHLSRNHGYEVSYARVDRDASGRMALSVIMARKD